MNGHTLLELFIDAQGVVRSLYSDELDLRTLGRLDIRRASHVEADQGGAWRADLGPSGGPVLGPFMTRAEALKAEQLWLNQTALGGKAESRA